jgi:hypothetical protein
LGGWLCYVILRKGLHVKDSIDAVLRVENKLLVFDGVDGESLFGDREGVDPGLG